MADPTLVQAVTFHTPDPPTLLTLTGTWGTTPVQGNLLICATNSDNTMSMTSTGWTLAESQIGGGAAYIWYKVAGSSESMSVVVTTSTTTDTICMALEEWSATGGGWALDQIANHAATGGIVTCASGTAPTSTQATELLIAVVGPHNENAGIPTGPSWTNSFTQRLAVQATWGVQPSSSATLFVADLVEAAVGSFSTACTWSNAAADAGGIIATFKFTSTGSGPTSDGIFGFRSVGPRT